MESFNFDKKEVIQYVKKYSRVGLRYLIVLIIWMVRETVIILSFISSVLKVLWEYVVRCSIAAWKWIKWASPIVWAWTKVASAVAWHLTCKFALVLWTLTKVLSRKLLRLTVTFLILVGRLIKSKYEQYLEFRRTKGFRGLMTDVSNGVRTSFNHYMDEDQVTSTDHVMSDDELIAEELSDYEPLKLGQRFDHFLKKIVNE